jgi:hypothetical protein
MASEIGDLIILYDSSVEITGRFHYKDELKVKEGSFGPCASFAILVEKPKKDKISKHYIFARAYGEKNVEKLKRIEKGTFIRVLGELESGFGGTYVNVKVITPVSAIELQDMLSRQKEPEEDLPEEIMTEDHEEFIGEEEIREAIKEEGEEIYKDTDEVVEEDEIDEMVEEEPAEGEKTEQEEETGWSSTWKKKKRRGIF